MAYSRTNIKNVIAQKIKKIGKDTKQKFEENPTGNVDVSKLEEALAEAVTAGFDQLVRDAVIDIPVQSIIPTALVAPSGPVTGTIIIPKKTGTIT